MLEPIELVEIPRCFNPGRPLLLVVAIVDAYVQCVHIYIYIHNEAILPLSLSMYIYYIYNIYIHRSNDVTHLIICMHTYIHACIHT